MSSPHFPIASARVVGPGVVSVIKSPVYMCVCVHIPVTVGRCVAVSVFVCVCAYQCVFILVFVGVL